MSKKLLDKKNFRKIGIIVMCLGAVFAATMVFLVTGSALVISLAVGITVAVAGVIMIIVAYSTLPGELPPADYRNATIKLTLCAMFIGLAALTKLFSITIPIFGSAGMRVGFGGVFTTFPAILFGPLYGGITSAASDIIGWFIDPQGGYNPLFTLTAFIGGVIKGLIWITLKKANPGKLRRAFTVCFALILVIGTAFYISFAVDGISRSIIAETEEMPSKGLANNRKNSFLTSLIIKRVRVSDTYTITDISDRESVIIPGKALVDGANGNVALGEKAFEGNDSIKEVYLADSLTSFNGSSLKGKDIIIYLTENCKALEEVKKSGLEYALVASVDERTILMRSDNMVFNELTFVSNNKYAKNLAGNVNYVAFGLTLVGVLGLAAVLIEYLLSRRSGTKTNKTQGVRIFTAIFTAEIIQTTINTIILKELTYKNDWAAYPFMIVWIPRAAEGLIICLIQAYFIALLYTLLMGKTGALKLPKR